MKIEIITDRKPFINGKAANMGDVIEVDDADGKAMVANGFALTVEAPKKKSAKKAE
jgi:hypothetical protein